jgi:hypothetical protein
MQELILDKSHLIPLERCANLFKEIIKDYPKVLPAYAYSYEKSINPAYCDIDNCAPLCPNEKKIWVL